MLDLFSGLGGASHAMKDRGWSVITVDINSDFQPDIVADVRDWHWNGRHPDLLWASPPCDEFARESMPWSRTGNKPDVSLILATLRIVAETQPRYWMLENVRGAVPWVYPFLGAPRTIIGAFYLWGFFPPLSHVDTSRWQTKSSLSSSASAGRARIPYDLSLAVAIACERQPTLLSLLEEKENPNLEETALSAGNVEQNAE